MEEHAPVFLPCKDDFMFSLTINLLQYHIYPTNNPPMFSKTIVDIINLITMQTVKPWTP